MQKSFNLKGCQVLVDNLPVSGFDTGDVVIVQYDSDQWTKTVGADGEAVRHKTNNEAGSFEFKLGYGSMTTQRLEAIRQLDRAAGKTVSILVFDPASGSRAFTPAGWVIKPPALMLGAEAKGRAYKFDCGRLTMDHSGISGIGANIG